VTANSTSPLVLHVDDEPDDLRLWQGIVESQGRVRLEVCHPDDVTHEDLRDASLVLIDFKIEHWEQRDNIGALALRPTNGLALSSVLQEAAYDLDKDRPRAFALFTAVVKDVARGLVPQPHIVARAHNLEWVFDKASSDPEARASRVADLAEAVRALPQPWPGDSSEHASQTLKAWLKFPSECEWHAAAWDGVLRCHPPIHEFAEHTHGIGVLRWALHRVWPYPTFLLSDVHLAARLRVELPSLSAELESNEELRRLFTDSQYTGPLASFVGRRWWRAAVEDLVFRLASTDPSNLETLHGQLVKIAPDLKVCEPQTVFPLLDQDFNFSDRLGSEDEVIEVIPDDWPPYADQAWALKADVEEHADLAAIAVRAPHNEG
jgi:hypothetical protein